jgi:hypothetical protein
VCVDPASLDGPANRLRRAVFPTVDVFGRRLRELEEVTTPFAARSNHYAGGCTRGDRGYAYLGVDFEDDGRFARAKLGLHMLDMQLPQGDLVALLQRRLYSVAK